MTCLLALARKFIACQIKINEADANLAAHRIALQTVISQLEGEVTDEAISNDEVEDSIGNK